MKLARSGTSLVEVMAAMAGNMLICGLAVVALIAVGRADRSLNDRLEQRQLVARLIAQLRDDVHAAESLAWDEQGRELRLMLPTGELIVYAGEYQRWTRRSVAEEDNGEGELAGAFRTPRRLRLNVEPAAATEGELVRIAAITPAQDRPDDDSPSTELVVAVGRDRRLLHQ